MDPRLFKESKQEESKKRKFAYFSYINILDNNTLDTFKLSLPTSEEFYQGSKIRKSITVLAFEIIHKDIQNQFKTYIMEDIKTWDELKKLFNTLKSKDYCILTFNNERQEINSFDEFKIVVQNVHKKIEQENTAYHSIRKNS